MIFYLLLPLFSLILLVLQTTVLSLFFMGKMGFEISLIIVIYAGFRMDALKGGILAFVLGFFLDCITGSVTGLLTFYYVAVFFISRTVSFRVYAERYLFIMAFAFLCAFSEGLFVALVYQVFYGVDVFPGIYKIFLVQGLTLGLFSPLLFTLLGRLEGVVDVRESP
jgi:rod shape-determining protein MreD